MPLVSVFMDVEDPINLAADDAALDLAQLFSTCGARGSFCVTGEKCRSLRKRGRLDVAEALLPHSLGLHTDTHSYHPTTMELLADLEFDAGCSAVMETESRGKAAFQALFGRSPSFWGGAGNTWSPEVTVALRQLGIPGYSYALTYSPGEPVHRFNGVLAFPQHLSISEDDWMDDDRAAARSESVLNAINGHTEAWLGVFVGHPTRFRHEAFWDAGYALGKTPAEPPTTAEVPLASYERALTNLAGFLKRLKSVTEVIGVDEAVDLPWCYRTPTVRELEAFLSETSSRLRSAAGWPIHRANLDVDLIVRKTIELSDTVEIASLP